MAKASVFVTGQQGHGAGAVVATYTVVVDDGHEWGSGSTLSYSMTYQQIIDKIVEDVVGQASGQGTTLALADVFVFMPSVAKHS